MTTFEFVRLAFSRLGASRLRSALTMLGVIIGVASVVALVAVGQGATAGVTARLNGLGTNLLTVTPRAESAPECPPLLPYKGCGRNDLACLTDALIFMSGSI